MSKLAILTCLALVAAPAFATVDPGPRQEPVAITVPFEDLDLATPAGVDRLTVRLTDAMRNVCGTRPVPKLLNAQVQFEACKAALATTSTDHAVLIAFERARKALG